MGYLCLWTGGQGLSYCAISEPNMADAGEGTSISTEEPFQTVKRRSKRKMDKVENMEKDDDQSRPSFPPVKVAKTAVNIKH